MKLKELMGKVKLKELMEKAQEQIKSEKERKVVTKIVNKLKEVDELNKSLRTATQQLNELLNSDLEEIDVDVF